MALSNDAKLVAAITVLTIPTIEYGGTFLLALLSGGHSELGLTDFQRSMFRAGHAHAGVLVLLSLIAQILIDEARLPRTATMILRLGFVAGALAISGGFFAAAAGSGLTAPNGMIGLLWVGVLVEGAALLGLGVALLKSRVPGATMAKVV
jgi:hypothetical protein